MGCLFIGLRHDDGDGVGKGAFSGGVEGGDDDFPLTGLDGFFVAGWGAGELGMAPGFLGIVAPFPLIFPPFPEMAPSFRGIVSPFQGVARFPQGVARRLQEFLPPLSEVVTRREGMTAPRLEVVGRLLIGISKASNLETR